MKEFLENTITSCKERQDSCLANQEEKRILKQIEESFYDAGYEIVQSRIFKEAALVERNG